jgi:glycosyltransferase involved in cell wall biosynthesis
MFLAQLSPLILPALRGRPALLHLGSYHLACPLGTRILPDGSACNYHPGVACYRQTCVGPVGLLRTAVQQRAWSRWRSVFRLLVANSQAMALALRDAGLEVDTVIRNGTRIVEPRPPLGDSPIIACAGRLVPAKGVDDLLAAMPLVAQRAPQVRLLIVGDGPDRHRIEELVRRSPVREQVTLHGHLDRPSLDHLLREAWVQVLPSRFREPSSNVLPEAMMRGSAVVATATGGTPEIVQHGVTGFLVPPGNPAELAGRLVEVVGNRDLAERMGAAGRKVALAELTTERMAERFEATYRALVTAPAPVASE